MSPNVLPMTDEQSEWRVWIARPIQRITVAAQQLAHGEFSQQITVRMRGRDEIDELAAAFNTMSSGLRIMMAQLTDEQRKLQAILNKTDDGLIFVDADERIRILNPAAARLLGVEEEQVVGQPVIAGTINTPLTELINRVLRTKIPGTLDIRLNRLAPIVLNVYVTPLEYSEGETGALVVMHDQTEVSRTEEMRRDFVANVSHELRTPLASVRAMAETIVLHAGKDLRVAEEFAGKIIMEVDRLSAVSDDLLDLAQIESGRQPVRWQEMPLADVITQVLTNLAPLAREKQITLSSYVSPAIHIVADREAVEQILINLVDNAVKYTPANGTITVTAHEEQERVAITVVDTGIGIPPADRHRIFERFYRVDKGRSRASGGTGLGLAIVKHLVESHGGKVTVDSTPGNGSAFTFTLPLNY
jgi:two-component system phosphate regulon sensor histidine kinase PhoR